MQNIPNTNFSIEHKIVTPYIDKLKSYFLNDILKKVKAENVVLFLIITIFLTCPYFNFILFSLSPANNPSHCTIICQIQD